MHKCFTRCFHSDLAIRRGAPQLSNDDLQIGLQPFILPATDGGAMRIVVISEKPFIAKTLAPIANALWPHDHVVQAFIGIFGLYNPPHPFGLSWKDFPIIAPFDIAAFRRKPTDNLLIGTFEHGVCQKRDWDGLVHDVQSADTIINLADPYYFDTLCHHAIGRRYHPSECKVLDALDAITIHKRLTEPGDEGSAVREWEATRTRRYFDHQFAVNSAGILSRWLEDGEDLISKYQIQMLYAIRRGVPVKEGQWTSKMAYWKGSGAFGEREAPMGSSTSRNAIIEHLWRRRWIERIGSKQEIWLSRRGEAMLDRLAPTCEDPDLSYRIQQWAAQGLDASKGEIDRYILDFFQAQKSFDDAFNRSGDPKAA